MLVNKMQSIISQSPNHYFKSTVKCLCGRYEQLINKLKHIGKEITVLILLK